MDWLRDLGPTFAALLLALASAADATQLVMPINSSYNFDGGPVDIDYHKDGACGTATGIMNGTDFADAENQGSPGSWEAPTYTWARTMGAYQGGGGFQWFDTYPNNFITYLLKSAPPQVKYYKVRAVAFDPPFPCNPFSPPPRTGDTSMTIEFEELPVFKNGFETSELEEWSSSTHPI